MTGLDFTDIDPLELLQRLTLHAYLVFGCFPDPNFERVLPAHGEGPEDLAMDTMKKLLDPDDHSVAWSNTWGPPTLDGVLGFLQRVLTNDFVDRKRSKRFKCHAELPPIESADGTGLTLDELAVHLETPEVIMARREQHERLIGALHEEPDLQDVLRLLLDPEGYNAYTNIDIANLLGISVSDVENRKKRIIRRLVKQYRQSPEPRAAVT